MKQSSSDEPYWGLRNGKTSVSYIPPLQLVLGYGSTRTLWAVLDGYMALKM